MHEVPKILIKVQVEGRIEAYTQKGFSEEYALQQARLAKLLHWGMYDEQTNEVKLWNEKFNIGHI